MMSEIDERLALLDSEKQDRAPKDHSMSSVVAVVLSIEYADFKDHRVSASGETSSGQYGSPTATVYLPSAKRVKRGVKIMQNGSATRNMSIWLPTPSTHTKGQNGAILVPRMDVYGEFIEPLEMIEANSVEQFDGDVVIVQNLPTGVPNEYTTIIIGSVPKSSPAYERLHFDPLSRNPSDIGQSVNSYSPVSEAETLENLGSSYRGNNLSQSPFVHPSVAVTSNSSLPPKDEGQSLTEYIAESYNNGVLDRTSANPIGLERYLSHNGTILRIDQQGNVIIDTALAGVQNNELDVVPSAQVGDRGHMDINILRRAGQGLNIRIGGEVVFSITAQVGGSSVISLGKELAQAFSSVLGERLQEVFDNHQHMTAQGFTTKPVPIQEPTFAGDFPSIAPTDGTVPSSIDSANQSTSTTVFAHDILLRQR